MSYGKILVSRDDLAGIVASLSQEPVLAIDTETTGLDVHGSDRPFSIVVCDGRVVYYFNFNGYEDVDEEFVLSDDELRSMQPIFDAGVAVFHNAKFDIGMLEKQGLDVRREVHDTMVTARLLNCNELSLSLDALAERVGVKKDDKVKAYALKHKLYDDVSVPGTKLKKKRFRFHEVPFVMIYAYACQDAWATWTIYLHQRSKECGQSLRENEHRLIRTCLAMERRGVRVDKDYCREAISHLERKRRDLEDDFKAVTGLSFKNSPKFMSDVFKDEDLVYGKVTPTGKRNAKFSSDVLEAFKHPAARIILDMREAEKSAQFFHALLHHTGSDGVLHASFNQAGTITGRFSSSDPNLQNLPKPDEEKRERFPVRRAIIPREGMVFHMLDYDQMEYRLLLNYCRLFKDSDDGVEQLVRRIRDEGLDIHQAMAEKAGITRGMAKTVNFATLYGSGPKLIAQRLGVSEAEAHRIRGSVFEAAPEIKTFIDVAMQRVKKHGYVRNWMGRRYEIEADKAYRAPNYIIQGGCADTVKRAMNVADEYRRHGIYMVATIHDELVFESTPQAAEKYMHRVREIMQNVYSTEYLPLTCGVDHSFASLGDKVGGYCFE